MKLLAVLVLVDMIYITSVHGRDFNDGIMKVQKVLCSSSGKSVEKVYCRVKPINRKTSYINFGGYLKKTTRDIIATHSVYHRPLIGGNFVRLVRYENVNVCDLVNLAVSNPIFEFAVGWLNGTILKGLIHKCPYKAGWHRVENGSLDVDVMSKWDFVQRFPNGEYRTDEKLFNKFDENILSVSIFYIYHMRDNALSSFDKM